MAKGNLDFAVEENVHNQAQILAESSPVIARLVRDGKLKVAGASMTWQVASSSRWPLGFELNKPQQNNCVWNGLAVVVL